MSSWDLDRAERLRHARARSRSRASTATAATCGTPPTTTGARASAPRTQLNDSTVLRGGFGITYLPTQHRLLLGTDRLRLGELLRRRHADRVRHEPARRAGDPVLRSGADLAGDRRRPGRAARSTASARRGSTVTSRTARRGSGTSSSNGAVGDRWMASIGYSASVSRNLLNRSFPIQNLQSIPADDARAVARSSSSTATARSTRRRSSCRTRSSRRAVRCCRSPARSVRRPSRVRTRCSRIRC